MTLVLMTAGVLTAGPAQATITPKPVSAVAHNSVPEVNIGTFDPNLTSQFGGLVTSYRSARTFTAAAAAPSGLLTTRTTNSGGPTRPTELFVGGLMFRNPGPQTVALAMTWNQCTSAVLFSSCTTPGQDNANATVQVAPTPLHDSPRGDMHVVDRASNGLTFTAPTVDLATYSVIDGADNVIPVSQTVFWGDGTSTCTYGCPGSAGVPPSHHYPATGNYNMIVETKLTRYYFGAGVDSVAGAAATMRVVDAGTASGNPIAATEGQAFSGRVATISDATCADCTYTADVAWGDGVHSAGTVTANGAGYLVKGTHLYGEQGVYDVSVHILTKVGTATVADQTVTGTATVDDAPLVASTGADLTAAGNGFTGQIGTFSDLNPSGSVGDYQVGVDWGDGTTSSATITAQGGAIFGVSGGHTYPGAGDYHVTFQVHSTRGRDATGTATIHAGDEPPLN